MKSEELKNRITLQILETITNENGFEVEAWTDFKDLWASVTNLHGREYFEASAVHTENTVKFNIRYTDEIDTTMRILFKGKQYNINSIDNIKYKNKYIEIKALEVDSSG
jgi:phage head-tail adaptor, putative, SPP1 family